MDFQRTLALVVLVSELREVLEGLTLARTHGYMAVDLQVDSRDVNLHRE